MANARAIELAQKFAFIKRGIEERDSKYFYKRDQFFREEMLTIREKLITSASAGRTNKLYQLEETEKRWYDSINSELYVIDARCESYSQKLHSFKDCYCIKTDFPRDYRKYILEKGNPESLEKQYKHYIELYGDILAAFNSVETVDEFFTKMNVKLHEFRNKYAKYLGPNIIPPEAAADFKSETSPATTTNTAEIAALHQKIDALTTQVATLTELLVKQLSGQKTSATADMKHTGTETATNVKGFFKG